MAVQSRKLGIAADRPPQSSSSPAATLLSSEQRQFLLLFSIFATIRLHFALSNSYIHPDEHFQGPEVIVGDIFGWKSSLPWEFTSDNPVNSPIRSILPIWLVYGLPIRIIKSIYGDNPDPMPLFRALRLTFFGLSFFNDWAVYRLAGETHCRSAVLLYASSYVTWTFQTHTFSNSIEAVLVSCTLVTILRFKHTRANVSWTAFSLGILCSLGVFFRITFPAFVLPAMISCIPELLRRPQKLILPGLSFLFASLVSIAADTFYFSPHPSLSHPIVTPWSNFKYNVNALNLAEHGLHPPWTHLLVNLPCLLGPSLFIPFIVLQPFRTSIRQLFGDICFLCSVSGLILLSSRPHQEFRFLLPIITLLLVSLSKFLPPNLFCSSSGEPGSHKANSSSRPRTRPKPGGSRFGTKYVERPFGWCVWWIFFNVVAGVFMGSLHQSAIVPTTRYLATRIRQAPFPPVCLRDDKSNLFRQTRMIWHRTYPAPDWLFGQPLVDGQTSIEIYNLGGRWNRLWEMLGESAQVPIGEARVEQAENSSCDAWYIASNNTLQRTFVIAPLSAVPLHESIIERAPNRLTEERGWGLFPIRKIDYHINLDDVDLNKESVIETIGRVMGRHGLGVWLLVSI